MKNIITDLRQLYSLIETSKNSSSGSNTTSLQIILDLLVDFPLCYEPTINEIYKYYNYDMWIQSIDKNSNFMVAPIISDNSLESITLFKSEWGKDDSGIFDTIKFKKKTLQGDKLFEYLHSSAPKRNILPFPNDMEEINMVNDFPKLHGHGVHINKLFNRDRDDINTSKPVLNRSTGEISNILDHREYSVIQLPTEKLNYYITKFPFTIRRDKTTPILHSSNYVFPKKELKYELLVYEDRIVYLEPKSANENNVNDLLNTMCVYKVFKIPTLEITETGSDTILNTYNRLKLTRKGLMGPNVYANIIKPAELNKEYKKAKIQYGFKVINGDIYDIYTNSFKPNSLRSRYKKKLIDGKWVLIYY